MGLSNSKGKGKLLVRNKKIYKNEAGAIHSVFKNKMVFI